MARSRISRRHFLQATGAMAGGYLLPSVVFSQTIPELPKQALAESVPPPDYELTIATKPIELAPNRIVSVTTYNGQFPGPLLRFQEGSQSPSTSTTRPIPPSSSTGTGSSSPPMSMAPPRKAPPSSPPTAAAASALPRDPPGCASTTPTCTPARIWPPANTPAWSAPSISNPKTTPASTTRKCS